MIPRQVDNQSVRVVERASIRAFVESCSNLLSGTVLDYGCGEMPYRDIVHRAGGEYQGFDRVAFPANVSGIDIGYERKVGQVIDTVLCTQVAQYWPDPSLALQYLHGLITHRGHLVMTYPTTWAEVEEADLWRYTKTGMERLLAEAGFTVTHHVLRADINLGGFKLPLGYGVVANA